MTRADIAMCEQAGLPLAGINNAYQITDKLKYLYACDSKWWLAHYPYAKAHWKYSLQKTPYFDVWQMENDGQLGLATEWPKIRTGQNSGYQAINLAYLLGYTTIILLGYDMQPINGKLHWHEDHKNMNNPNKNNLQEWCSNFESIAQELESRGVTVLNASRQTALECFQRVTLEDVL